MNVASRLKIASRSLTLISLIVVGTTAASIAGERHIHPGDKLEVTVFNHPELSESVTVDAENRIALPLAGPIDTSNTSDEGLATRIRRRLLPYVPEVAVEVHTSAVDQSLLINGGPVGSLPYTPGESLASAITQLNSLTRNTATQANATSDNPGPSDFFHGRTNLHAVRIVRDGNTIGRYDAAHLLENGDSGPRLLPGDTIVIASKPIRVLVQGEVREPGSAFLDIEEPLENALKQAGGDTSIATSRVILSRDGQQQTLALGDPIFRDPAHKGDIIIVPRAPRIGVVGAVDKPGDVTLHGDASLLSAIYNAGGPTKVANLKSVTVIHNGVKQEYNLIAAIHGGSGNPMLSDGDTVFVPVGHHPDYSSFWQAIGAAGSVIYAVK